MRTLFTTIAVCFMLLGSALSAHADPIRSCVGPFLANATGYFPSAAGINTRYVDGQVTINTWKAGGGTISADIELTGYTTTEDPTNASFVLVATRTGSAVDELLGPLERLRFNVTSCTGDCSTWVKICGRISN